MTKGHPNTPPERDNDGERCVLDEWGAFAAVSTWADDTSYVYIGVQARESRRFVALDPTTARKLAFAILKEAGQASRNKKHGTNV